MDDDAGARDPFWDLRISGEWDLARVEELRELLKPLIEKDIAVINIEHVTYMDSSILGCLVGLKRRMTDGGREGKVIIAGANSNISRLFAVAGLNQVFSVEP